MPVAIDPQQVTIIALLFAIGAAGLRKMWVFGFVLEDKQRDLEAMTTDRNFWRDTALKALTHTDKAIDVVEKTAEKR